MITYDEIPRELNLATYFLDRNLEEGRGDRVALCCGDERVTFAELARLTNRTGHVLRDLGVRPEERVLLALSDSVEFVAAWFAVLKIGGVTAEAYTFLQPKDYEYYLHYSKAGVAIVDGTHPRGVPRGRPQLPAAPDLLVVGADDGPRHSTRRRSSLSPPGHRTSSSRSRRRRTTSQSGSSPRGARVHRRPRCTSSTTPSSPFTTTRSTYSDSPRTDAVLPVPKLFFGYARDMAALFNFGVGGAGVIFPERTTPEVLASLIERHRPTVMVQVPTMINAMVNHPDATTWDLSCLRLCTSAGEALPEEVHRRWVELFGVEVLDGIGSSEAYHIYISNRPGAARVGSLGQTCPGFEAIVVGEDGNEVPDGEPGELRVRGESTALCYWGDHDKSKRTFAGDWILSGDLFVRDAAGYFWYQGRADDLLKVSGIWVAPLEIESCLLKHPAVAECAVLGYEEDGRTRIRAYVVRKTGADAGREDLREFARSHLAGHKVPRDVQFVDSLPKTANDKVDRKALKAVDANASAAAR